MTTLAPQLEALNAQNDEVALKGALQKVFAAQLPQKLIDRKVDETILDEGFVTRNAVRALGEHHLREMGFNMGETAQIYRAIFPLPLAAPIAAAQQHAADFGGQGGGQQPPPPQQPVRQTALRKFPKLGANSYPEAEGWMVYVAAFKAHHMGRISEATKLELENIDDDPRHDMAGWVDSCPDDLVMWNSMLNGPDSMPDELVAALPVEIVAATAVAKAYRHITRAIHTVSDEAAAVILKWFVNPPPMLQSKIWMLSSSILQWKKARVTLKVMDAEQSSVVCRVSLDTLVAKLPDVKSNLAALKAQKQAVGHRVTVQEMLTSIQQVADTQHSVKVQNDSVAMYTAFGAVSVDTNPSDHPPPPPPPRQKTPAGKQSKCWHWAKPGSCSRGTKCRFLHEGMPGADNNTQCRNNNNIRKRDMISQHDIHPDERWYTDRVSGNCDYGYNSTCDEFNSTCITAGIKCDNKFSVLEADVCVTDSGTEKAMTIISATKPLPPIPPSTDPVAMVAQRHAEFDAWLDARVARVAGELVITMEAALSLVLGGLQASNPSSEVKARAMLLGMRGIIADSGATVRVIGRDHIHLIRNRVKLGQQVMVQTAQGEIRVTEMGDLPGFGGLMTGCLIIPESSASLLPIGGVCEELDLGYEVAQGNVSAGFTRDGKLVHELEREGNLHILNDHPNNNRESYSAEVSHVLVDDLDTDTKLLHDMVLLCCMGSGPDTKVGEITGSEQVDPKIGFNIPNQYNHHNNPEMVMTVNTLDSKAMLQHRLEGHITYNPKCPECVMGKLRARQALRKIIDSRPNPAGCSISVDLSGPFTKGVGGGVYGLVGVESGSDWGYVGMQGDRKAISCLKSVQDLEVELKRDSGNPNINIVSIYHDDDKSFRGELEEYAREKGWHDSHTGGYNPKANSKCERRIGMLQQLFRVVLLVATGGTYYYDQLWDVGLKYSNWVTNNHPWPDGPSPVSTLSGFPVIRSKNAHVFGAYCLFYIPKELRDGKHRPPSEMGIWVGLDTNVSNGHLVVPIKWDHKGQYWELYGVITATTVKVYDSVLPLKMRPPPNIKVKVPFDEFVDSVIHPLYDSDSDYVESEGEGSERGEKVDKNLEPNVKDKSKVIKPKAKPKVGNKPKNMNYEVESIEGNRMKGKVRQYKIKWKGYNPKYNTWVDCKDVNSPRLVQRYNASLTCRSQEDIAQTVRTLVALSVTAGVVNNSVLPGLDVFRAVDNLMKRQNLDGPVEDFAEGYLTELEHMLDKRLELIGDSDEAARIMIEEAVVSLRMQLEPKKDGRRKARLLLQGFKEPAEWDIRSNVSPTVSPSTIKSLIYMTGPRDHVISCIDISVAFLQSELYGEDEPNRYVSYTPYKDGPSYVFKLLGPIYGQRSAPRAFYETLSKWLIGDPNDKVNPGMGYRQCHNDPCLYVHPNGHTLVTHVDDILCRGSVKDSEYFYERLAQRFQCKDPEYVTPNNNITFTGMDIGMEVDNNGAEWYTVSQERELREFLIGKGLDQEKIRTSPMNDRSVITRAGELGPNMITWCKSVIGGLYHTPKKSEA